MLAEYEVGEKLLRQKKTNTFTLRWILPGSENSDLYIHTLKRYEMLVPIHTMKEYIYVCVCLCGVEV